MIVLNLLKNFILHNLFKKKSFLLDEFGISIIFFCFRLNISLILVCFVYLNVR
jgi:hypothetical protein